MTEPIVSTRLLRNLRYKITYVHIFEGFLASTSDHDAIELFQGLIQVQQAAISALAAYLRRLDVSTHDLELNEKLLAQAAERKDLRSQLQFVYDGLERATDWYRMQLVDRQMTSDPELRQLLLELGEMEAAKLWRAGAVMGILRIPTKFKPKELEPESVPEPTAVDEWRPRLIDDFGRPSWTGQQPSRWSTPPKGRRKDRSPR